MTNLNQGISYSLGYNFDIKLIEEIAKLNSLSKNKIREFYASLVDSPVPSARPVDRILPIGIKDFSSHIDLMHKHNIEFNYLMNAPVDLNKIGKKDLEKYLAKLNLVGIRKITVNSPKMCSLIKSLNASFVVIISSIYSVQTTERLQECIDSGADEVYIDSIAMNRNFRALKELLVYSTIPLRVYANISCISDCPVKKEHYDLFGKQFTKDIAKQNDDFFRWCTVEKLKKPVNWLQMQWIRPEDIQSYANLGLSSFKLSDRLATTTMLVYIAKHYLDTISPKNLFPLMERNGTKFDMINKKEKNRYYYVENSKIPVDFLKHFSSNDCKSNDSECIYCNKVANNAISIVEHNDDI